MVSNFVLLSIFAFLFYGLCHVRGRLHPNNSVYIVGGHKIPIENAPYQVHLLFYIRNGVNHTCGGSILNTRYILTAAHCLEHRLPIIGQSIKPKRIDVRIGSSDRESGGSVHSTNTFIKHPKYHLGIGADYDVGIIKLNEDMKLHGEKTKAVSLPNENAEIPANTELLVTGWGDISEGGPESRYLMAVKVNTFANDRCIKSYKSEFTDRMICAGAENGGRDSCQGDSGGPAVNHGVQLGIVSWGYGCARKDSPGVYTKIIHPAVRQWIKTNTGV